MVQLTPEDLDSLYIWTRPLGGCELGLCDLQALSQRTRLNQRMEPAPQMIYHALEGAKSSHSMKVSLL